MRVLASLMLLLISCEPAVHESREQLPKKSDANEPPAVVVEPDVVEPAEPAPPAPPPSNFDPSTASSAKVRIVAVHREGWVACGVIHSTGAIEVEVLEVGEPAPRMILIISCPADFGHRQLLEIGAVVHVELFARRQRWPTPPAARELPPELPRRYVKAMTPTSPGSAPAPQSSAAPE